MRGTFSTWQFSRISGLTGLGLLCLMSPAASAVTSGSLLLARTFDKTVAVTNSPILVTTTLTNTSPDALRGFYYFDEVPTGLKMTTVSVTLKGAGLTNFSFESGLDGEIYVGYTLRRWWLETPTNFAEANPVPPQGVVQIVYSISCATTGTFALQEFGCVACKSDKTNTLYGYSGTADQQTVSFVPGNGPMITTPPASQSVVAGASVNFSVAAAALLPLSYQWRFNGAALPGATSTNLALSNVQPTNAGSYSVVVTNVAGAVTSAVTTLSVTVPGSCVSAPAGIVGWWPGMGNANDIAGTNNGSLQGGATATATGLAGMAFSFDGTNGLVQIPDSPALRQANLTIETWVLFSALNSWVSGAPSGDQYIVFKQNTHSSDFEGFDLSKTRVGSTDIFRFIVSSASGQAVEIHSTTALAASVWYHVAAVRGSNFTQVYVNGRLEGQASVTAAQDYGAYPLYFGTSGNSSWDGRLKGLLDEVSLYNRALSSNEVAAIYAAGASGKCKAGYELSIAAQPESQAVTAGGAASFTVTAIGTAPLRYQWRFNGINLGNGGQISGSGGATLTVSNVQATNAGSYSVVVANSAGTVTSSSATLTLSAPKPQEGETKLLAPFAQNGTMNLTLSGQAGSTYAIEVSSDLVNWSELRRVTLSGTTIQITDSTASGPRFYRTRWVQ